MEIVNVYLELVDFLKSKGKIFSVKEESSSKFEVHGTIPTMQGKQKVEGIYFASVVPKQKDVRFYFFPIYTHKDQIGTLSTQLQKALKGKSCFHLKKWDDEMKNDVFQLIDEGIDLYQTHNLLEK